MTVGFGEEEGYGEGCDDDWGGYESESVGRVLVGSTFPAGGDDADDGSDCAGSGEDEEGRGDGDDDDGGSERSTLSPAGDDGDGDGDGDEADG